MSNSSEQTSFLTRWLAGAPASAFTLYAGGVAFTTYFCMYAFRKPIAAAQFEGLTFLGTDFSLKKAIIISQIIGYALSKYIGIKYCSEITPARRARMLVALILMSEFALLMFAIVPDQWKVVAIFFGGLPLGMVWGLVVWYLEGRRTSEILLAILSCSFIVSSGAVKDVGRNLMMFAQVTESWMPFATGVVFLLPFLISVWLLKQLPPPDEDDVAARTLREPMDGAARIAFFLRFLPGLILLLVVYFFLTAYRDFRDNYGIEIFVDLGYQNEPAIFTRTELPVAFGVLAALAALNLIKNNAWGLVGVFGIMIGGTALMGVSTLLLDAGLINGGWWMILVGLGVYLAFVPFGSVLFERLIASTHFVGTAVFAIYVADAIGYTGSVGVQLYQEFFAPELSWLAFFRGLTYLISILGTTLLAVCGIYFFMKSKATGKE